MYTLKIKQYRAGNALPRFHFFVLCKGNNSGRPGLSPCPNCFIVSADTADELDHLYWLNYALHASNGFYQIIKGSVIPYITIYEYRQRILQACRTCPQGHSLLPRMVGALNQLAQNEENTLQQLKTLRELRRCMLYKFLKL